MNELNAKEIKTILLLHKKADYNNLSQLEESVNLIEQRNMLSSPKAVLFKERLKAVCADKEGADYSCIFCGEKASDDKGLICPECEKKLRDMLTEPHEDVSRSEKSFRQTLREKRPKPEKRKTLGQKKEHSLKFRIPKKLAILALVLSFLILGTNIFLCIKAKKTYEDLLDKAGMIPGCEAVVMETMARENMDAGALKINAGAVEIKEDENPADENPADENPARDAAPVNDEPVELITSIGSFLGVVESKLGPSKESGGPEIRIFPSCGASVILVPNTQLISYVDIIEGGDIRTSLFGIECGRTKEEIYNHFKALKIDTPSASDGDSDYYYFDFDDRDYTIGLTITYEGDKSVLISAMVVNR